MRKFAADGGEPICANNERCSIKNLNWAVEHDYTYLVEPTTEERTEIYGIFPRAEPEEI